MFSKACKYGIKASVYIAKESKGAKRVNLTQISEHIDSPPAFTAKILQQLTRSGIIKSVKGPYGGFEIERGRIPTIKLADIVSAIDGVSVFVECGLGLDNCNDKKPCSIHHQFKGIRNQIKAMLEKSNLMDLVNDIDNGLAFLKR